MGKYGEYVYVAPDADTVVVRLGRDWGVNNVAWLAIFRYVATSLSAGPDEGGHRRPGRR
jgi:hypothetical protein